MIVFEFFPETAMFPGFWFVSLKLNLIPRAWQILSEIEMNISELPLDFAVFPGFLHAHLTKLPCITENVALHARS